MYFIAERLHARGERRSGYKLATNALFGEIAVVKVDVLIPAQRGAQYALMSVPGSLQNAGADIAGC